MLNRIYTLVICLMLMLSASQTICAQRDHVNPEPGAWKDKIGFGGNIGLRFGDITYVEVSPIAGYRIAPFLMPGIGATYRYISYHYSQYGSYSNNVYGGSVWLRAYVAPMIFGYAEYE